MINRLWRLRSDERGISLVFVSVGFLSFMTATTLAIDVGMFMTARTQAQTAADAGALAGATALAFNSFTDRSSTGPAVSSAVNAARANLVINTVPSVNTSDVTFPNDPVTGQNDRVKVTVYRTTARGNPLSTLIGWVFGINTADVTATATAAVLTANRQMCVLPFTIPDKWIEKQCSTEICPWDPSDTFEMYDNAGNLLPNPDVYIPPQKDGSGTGFNGQTDRGLQLTLKSGNGTQVSPSFYNPWDLPGSVGGASYRANISGCNPNSTPVGDQMAPENGNMVGPTKQGTDALIQQDPNAYWDTSCQCVKGSAFTTSPRIRPVPLYDPVKFAQGKQSGKANPQLFVVAYLGFFIENVSGAGAVTGRITPIAGQFDPGGPVATGGVSQAIMLVQ